MEVDDIQLRYNSPQFCHEAMAEFVELLVLPLTTALENLNVSWHLRLLPSAAVGFLDFVGRCAEAHRSNNCRFVRLSTGFLSSVVRRLRG